MRITTFDANLSDAYLTKISRIVLANGVGVGYRTTPWAWNSQEASETAWIAGEFPEADFLSFNWAGDQAHGTADEYFLREALKVIQELQRFNNNGASDCEPTSKSVSQKRIIFVAQDIGVPLVKHVWLPWLFGLVLSTT